jgi:hypothetical protein
MMKNDSTYSYDDNRGHAVTTIHDGCRYIYTFEICFACDDWIIWMGTYGPRGGYLRGSYVSSCTCMLEAL